MARAARRPDADLLRRRRLRDQRRRARQRTARRPRPRARRPASARRRPRAARNSIFPCAAACRDSCRPPKATPALATSRTSRSRPAGRSSSAIAGLGAEPVAALTPTFAAARRHAHAHLRADGDAARLSRTNGRRARDRRIRAMRMTSTSRLRALVYGAGRRLAPVDGESGSLFAPGAESGSATGGCPTRAASRSNRSALRCVRAGGAARRRGRSRLAPLGRTARRASPPSRRAGRLLAARLGERGRASSRPASRRRFASRRIAARG